MNEKIQDKKYSIFQNLSYCIRMTKEKYPILLTFCLLIIFVNTIIPVITAFLPKIIIEEITENKGMKELLDNRESLPNYKRQSLKRYYYYEDDIVIKDIINLFSHEQ